MARGAALALLVLVGACLERGSGERKPAPEPGAAAPPIAESIGPIVRSAPVGEPDPDAALRIRLEAEPSHLVPIVSGDGLAVRVGLGDIYEGLLCRAGPLDSPEPCLASTAVASDDHKTWRFEIRDGVRFHDGTALSSADVIRSIEVVAGGEIATPLTAEFDDIESVGEDSGAVVVRFKNARLDRAGAFSRLPIMRRSSFDGDLALFTKGPEARAPIGTGPFRVARWRQGETIELERFDDYWGSAAKAKRISYHIVSSRERTFAMIRNGKIDLATQLPVADALDIAALAGDLGAYTYRRPAYLAAVYNTRRPAASSIAKRRALTALLDREAVIAAILSGQSAPITGPYIGDEADDSITPIPFDPDAARVAFEPGERAEILYPLESRTMARIADIWAADARGAIALDVAPAPFVAVLERARAGDFDIALLAFTSGPELDMFTRLHSSQVGGENYGAIADAELDDRLEEVRASGGGEALARATRAAHRRIAEVAPYAFIATDVRAGVVASDIGGLESGDGLAARFLYRVKK